MGTAEGIARWWLDHPEVPKENVAMYFMNYSGSGLGGMIKGRLWLPSGMSEAPEQCGGHSAEDNGPTWLRRCLRRLVREATDEQLRPG